MKYFNLIFLILGIIIYTKSEIIRSCTKSKTIALTFDDGPYNLTQKLVDYLIDKNIKATFFTVGRFHYPFAFETEEYQKPMKEAHDFGMQIASHSYGHILSNDTQEFNKCLTDMDDFIEKVTGDRPRYFRPPYGECNEECQERLKNIGYRIIKWDVDTHDWDIETSGTNEKRAEDSIKILKEEFAKEKDNYLILMHDTEPATVNRIAPWIIEESGMKEKGYKFVTVAECLDDQSGMYQKSDKSSKYNSKSKSNVKQSVKSNDINDESDVKQSDNSEKNNKSDVKQSDNSEENNKSDVKQSDNSEENNKSDVKQSDNSEENNKSNVNPSDNSEENNKSDVNQSSNSNENNINDMNQSNNTNISDKANDTVKVTNFGKSTDINNSSFAFFSTKPLNIYIYLIILIACFHYI
ncbi:glycoside hydrolase/deacetylase [Anaeromyces robustus]|uniref:Glycoside hydrolase/deacetylase n=1 Tax=Anaeromyces robustus TaxID=1754192 RepID=A0A1Y1W996_9FUNG|nr:glycoside hydrolase/deacetylase [Anaeromyces robustus]|eukprot:ORX69826.1 glycoside hydrolase/deacetylase [Anaeromyces robustus]